MKRICILVSLLVGLTLASQVSAQVPAPEIHDTLTLIGFNDFHGSFLEDYNVPGAARLCATVNRMQEENPDMVVLAGGDNFSGGYFPRLTKGEPIRTLFKRMNVAYSAIGNHEFDWGIPSLLRPEIWDAAQYLAANICLDSLGEKRPDWAIPYAIHKMELKNGTPLRIAFIGISTPDTKTSALPALVKDLYFTCPVETARKMREKLNDSADLFILLTHIGTRMENGEVIFINGETEDLTTVEGIDGIFSGHSHKEVLGMRNGLPVVQARNYGRKLSCMRFEVFRNDSGAVQTRFLDAKLLDIGEEKDRLLTNLLLEFSEREDLGLAEVICTAEKTLSPSVYVGKGNFSPLSTLVAQSYCDLYKSLVKTSPKDVVLGVCNWGSVRTIMSEGEVTRLQAGNILPFGGVLSAFRFNGTELMQLLQYGVECKAGWMQYHDMEVEIKDGKVVRAVYTGNKNPVEILPKGSYIVLTENFVSSGGDGYNRNLFHERVSAFEAIPAEKRNPTDVFINYLKKLATIQSDKIHIPVVK